MKLTTKEKEIIELIRETQEINSIDWQAPILTFTKRGIEVSVTNNRKDDQIAEWDFFEDCLSEIDEDEAHRQILFLERLIKRIKKRLALAKADVEAKKLMESKGVKP